MFGGMVIAFPLIAAQIYKFVAPGLYKNERGAFLPFLIASPILFLMGAALVYFFFTPMVMWFFLAMQQTRRGRRGADFAAAEGVGISQPDHDADLLLRPGVPAAGGDHADGAGRPADLARACAKSANGRSSSPSSSPRC